jgi:hypothetical protein
MKSTWPLILSLVCLASPAMRPLSEDAKGLERHKFTAEELLALKQGEIIRECQREQGTQAMSNGVGLFEAPIEVVWQVLVELEYYDEIMPQTTVSVLLDEETRGKVVKMGPAPADEVEKLFVDNKPGFIIHDPENPDRFTLYSYQRNNFPWPASDRWCLLEIRHDKSTYTQSWTFLAGNMKNDFGTWHLKTFGENQTLGYLEIHVDLAIPATGPFMKYAMSLTMPDTYAAFRKRAKQIMAQKGAGLNPPETSPEGGKR